MTDVEATVGNGEQNISVFVCDVLDRWGAHAIQECHPRALLLNQHFDFFISADRTVVQVTACANKLGLLLTDRALLSHVFSFLTRHLPQTTMTVVKPFLMSIGDRCLRF